MYPVLLRLLGLAALALLALVMGYSIYVCFKRGKPVAISPDPLISARVPSRPYPRFSPVPDLSLPILPTNVPRSPPVTLEGYCWLINHALKNRVTASIPVPAFYLEPLLAYFAVDEADGRLALDVEALCDDDRAAHLCVRPVAGTTGEHRAIR